ncbi:hypothetical protein IAT38_002461 [Cryptococcus sp. DSM 104549]
MGFSHKMALGRIFCLDRKVQTKPPSEVVYSNPSSNPSPLTPIIAPQATSISSASPSTASASRTTPLASSPIVLVAAAAAPSNVIIPAARPDHPLPLRTPCTLPQKSTVATLALTALHAANTVHKGTRFIPLPDTTLTVTPFTEETPSSGLYVPCPIPPASSRDAQHVMAAEVIQDHEKEYSNELAVRKGEMVLVVGQPWSHWYWVKSIERTDGVGMVPADTIKIIDWCKADEVEEGVWDGSSSASSDAESMTETESSVGSEEEVEERRVVGNGPGFGGSQFVELFPGTEVEKAVCGRQVQSTTQQKNALKKLAMKLFKRQHVRHSSQLLEPTSATAPAVAINTAPIKNSASIEPAQCVGSQTSADERTGTKTTKCLWAAAAYGDGQALLYRQPQQVQDDIFDSRDGAGNDTNDPHKDQRAKYTISADSLKNKQDVDKSAPCTAASNTNDATAITSPSSAGHPYAITSRFFNLHVAGFKLDGSGLMYQLRAVYRSSPSTQYECHLALHRRYDAFVVLDQRLRALYPNVMARVWDECSDRLSCLPDLPNCEITKEDCIHVGAVINRFLSELEKLGQGLDGGVLQDPKIAAIFTPLSYTGDRAKVRERAKVGGSAMVQQIQQAQKVQQRAMSSQAGDRSSFNSPPSTNTSPQSYTTSATTLLESASRATRRKPVPRQNGTLPPSLSTSRSIRI